MHQTAKRIRFLPVTFSNICSESISILYGWWGLNSVHCVDRVACFLLTMGSGGGACSVFTSVVARTPRQGALYARVILDARESTYSSGVTHLVCLCVWLWRLIYCRVGSRILEIGWRSNRSCGVQTVLGIVATVKVSRARGAPGYWVGISVRPDHLECMIVSNSTTDYKFWYCAQAVIWMIDISSDFQKTGYIYQKWICHDLIGDF